MEKKEMLKIVKELPLDKEISILNYEGYEIFLLRPSKLSERFKKYDVHKNFQIWLRKEKRQFRPNHLRVFIDLFLRSRSLPNKKRELLLAFDNVFYGKSPDNELKLLQNQKFEHYLNPLLVTGYLAQLFIVEQEYCYHGESNFDPPTLFFQGWLRQFIDSNKEVDNLCMSVCNRQPPTAKYVQLENKKNKKYCTDLMQLWYLKE